MQKLDPELLQIEPTSYALFRHDVLNQPRWHRWPKEQIDEVIQKAREGDQEARDLLILSSLSYVFYRGWKYKDELLHADPMDLVSVGNLAMLEVLDKALSLDYPLKYLITQAACAIRHYVFIESPMIRRDQRHRVIPVVSLDESLGDSDRTYGDLIGVLQEADLLSAEEEEERKKQRDARLYQALDRLTEKQRTVVMRYFGLDTAPESFRDIGLSQSTTGNNASKLWREAQKRLRKLLSDQYDAPIQEMNTLTPKQTHLLTDLVHAETHPVAQRAGMILDYASSGSKSSVATKYGVQWLTVRRWCERWQSFQAKLDQLENANQAGSLSDPIYRREIETILTNARHPKLMRLQNRSRNGR